MTRGGEGRVSLSPLPVTPATQDRFKRAREMLHGKFIANNLACNFKNPVHRSTGGLHERKTRFSN